MQMNLANQCNAETPVSNLKPLANTKHIRQKYDNCASQFLHNFQNFTLLFVILHFFAHARPRMRSAGVFFGTSILRQ
jgi:hypothetical protein